MCMCIHTYTYTYAYAYACIYTHITFSFSRDPEDVVEVVVEGVEERGALHQVGA